MKSIEKMPEQVPVVESPVQKKSDPAASGHETEHTKTASFMEGSDSVLGMSSKQQQSPFTTFEVWFPADSNVNLDAFQLTRLSQMAGLLPGTATITSIKGGAQDSGLPGGDLSNILENANLRANAVDTALGAGGIYNPTDQTVAAYKGGSLRNSDVENQYIAQAVVSVTILFNTNAGRRAVSNIKDLALQIDSHTR